MIAKVLFVAAIVAVTGLAASAQADVARDRFLVAADDGAKQPDQMPSDEMKPDDQAQPDDQSDDIGSAKMGTEEGTHTGADQGTTPESDTSKVEQPERRNVPSNDAGPQ